MSEEPIAGDLGQSKKNKKIDDIASAETEPSILKIDRTTKFDPAPFIDAGWSIDEEDERSLTLTEIDLPKVRLEHMLQGGEKVINGEERLRRLKEAGVVRLDAKVLQTLLKNPEMIPKKWKEKTNGYPTYVFFDGTILRRANGHRFVLYLFWNGSEWNRGYAWLENYWDAGDPSAVLAS